MVYNPLIDGLIRTLVLGGGFSTLFTLSVFQTI
jgi:hypothetical protein